MAQFNRMLGCSCVMIQTWLPSGSNLTVRVTIKDYYGSASTFSVRQLNVTALSRIALSTALQQTDAYIAGASFVNESTFHRALLVAAEASTSALLLKSSVARSRILQTLGRLVTATIFISDEVAATIADALINVSPNVTSSQASDLMTIAELVVNQTKSISPTLGTTLMTSATNALAGRL